MRETIVGFVVILGIAVGSYGIGKISNLEKNQKRIEAMLLDASKVPEKRFTFHYAGKEQYSNNFSIYRYDSVTGAIERFGVSHCEGDFKEALPPYKQTEYLNLITSQSSEHVESLIQDLFSSFVKRTSEKKKLGQ